MNEESFKSDDNQDAEIIRRLQKEILQLQKTHSLLQAQSGSTVDVKRAQLVGLVILYNLKASRKGRFTVHHTTQLLTKTVACNLLTTYFIITQEKEQLQTDLIESQRQIDELNKV